MRRSTPTRAATSPCRRTMKTAWRSFACRTQGLGFRPKSCRASSTCSRRRGCRSSGGTVTASSRGAGHGSEFPVRLPAVDSQRSVPPQPEEPAVPSSARHCRVLVVDDNEDSVDSLAMLLEMMGHEVRTANDGDRALDLAREFRPEVGILDIGLPKMNGYELASRLREQPWGKDVVLVALTGWGQEEHRRRSAESGFNHHLTKPVELDMLAQILADADRCTAAR